MTHGVDTDFLVAVEVREHPFHRKADSLLDRLLDENHTLGRKRLLDTLLAATFSRAGIRRIITNNGADYRDFGIFEIIDYAS